MAHHRRSAVERARRPGSVVSGVGGAVVDGRQAADDAIAQSMGLDDISVRNSSSTIAGAANPNAASGQVIVFGKRLTDKLTVGFEQGLSIATNALRIEYALSNTLTVRVEAGTISGVGIVYRRSFD